MSDDAPTADLAAQVPSAEPEAVPGLSASEAPADGNPPPVAAQEAAASAAAQAGAADRPELIVAGAFAAGFLFAQILKRRGR